ncbi:hypothetical protein Slin15195_G105630 [Septoria linicola]|uniref:Uncharacterized protein n=1 Tax=Septoria linicola TaxID=215465 RepID=A0A9Q9AXJ8_9PEZI|nr:hypothetical protein Slin15195_G105630 [Septoria linicola]
MATPPDMAQQQQHDGDAPAKCKACGQPSMPELANDWCFGCHTILFTSAGQASATEQLLQSFPSVPANPEPMIQQDDRHRQAIGAGIARWKEDMVQWNAQARAFAQKSEAVKREAAALKQKEENIKHEWAALKQREQELKRREANIQAAQQQVFAYFNQTPRAQPPLNMQAIGTSGSIMTQPYPYSGTSINFNLVGTKYNPPAHNAHLASGAQRIPPEVRAGFKGHPITRTDSYSPSGRHAVSLTGAQIRQSIEQQNVSPMAMAGMRPRMDVARSTALTQAVERGESATLHMQEAQKAKTIQEAHHSRNGSASSSNALGIFTEGSTESTPGSSFVGAFSSPRPNKASPAHVFSPPRPPPRTSNADQDAIVHTQMAHENEIRTQNPGYAGSAIRLPQQSGTGRLLCPDCGTDKPIVKKRNDGIHCTSCFNKRNKAGENLQTIEQRGGIIQVQRAAPIAAAESQPNGAGQNLPRSENIVFGHPSASDKPLYEPELAQRRAEKEAAAGLQAQNASCTPYSAMMGESAQAFSYTSSPFTAGQYHARERIADPGLNPQQCPAHAGSGTPKRNHGEAFGVDEHEMVDSPMSQLSHLQSNKKFKRSPQQHLATAPQYSAHQATEAPASESNNLPLEFESSSSMGEETAQLSNLQDQHTTMYLPCPTTPGPALGYADASNFYMSGGRRGSSPTLEEFEASLGMKLLLENARLDKEKAEKEGVAEPKAQ